MEEEKVNEAICGLRKEKNLTQKELAELLHVSPSTISKWENGAATPDIYMLDCIAKLFKISVSELLGEKKAAIVESVGETEPVIHEKKYKKTFVTVLAGIILVLIAALVVYVTHQNRNTFKAEVVDEFLDTESHYFDYKSIYHIVIEYDGELTDEIVLNYPDELRDEYEQWFDTAEVIMFTFWEKYEGRDNILEAASKTLLFPEVE